MDIFEDIKKGKGQIKKDENKNKELEEKIRKLVELYNQYLAEMKKYDDNKKAWEKHLSLVYNMINSVSSFNCDVIGDVLAKLVSFMEKEKYVYNKSILRVEDIVSDRCGVDDNYEDYNAYLIEEESNSQKIHRVYRNNGNLVFYSLENNKVILKSNTRFNPGNLNVQFYNDKAERLVNVKRFEYIYDFIDFVINEYVNNKNIDLSKEGLYILLDKFLSGYEIKEDNVKKIKL